MCVSKDSFSWAWDLGPRGGKHWVESQDGVTVHSNRDWGETAVPLSDSSVGPYFTSLNLFLRVTEALMVSNSKMTTVQN